MDYQKQAQDFLNLTSSTLEVKLADDQSAPLWCKPGDKHGKRYAVALANSRGTYAFDFWDSIANAEKIKAIKLLRNAKSFRLDKPAQFRAADLLKAEGIKIRTPMEARRKFDESIETLKPGAYDILACLSLVYEDNFEDWCDSYGYDSDSKTADKTYTACIEQDRQLRRLFTTEELEQLEEIN